VCTSLINRYFGAVLMITPKNLIVHEIIGLKVKVVSSASKSYIGISGVVLDETLNTFVIETPERKLKRVPKKNCVFEFTLPDTNQQVRVKGEKLLNLPENRLKRGIHKI